MAYRHTLFSALLFALFPLLYYAFDYLNYSRAGKIAITGMATVALFSALMRRFQSEWIRYLFVFVVFTLFVNLAFQGTLRDIFGVEQDEMMVMQSILSTDKQESYEFWLQYRNYLIKHILIFISSFLLYCYLVCKQNRFQLRSITKKSLYVSILFFVAAHIIFSVRLGNPFVFFPYYYLAYKKECQELSNLEKALHQKINDNSLNDVAYIGKRKRNYVIWVIGESSTKHNWSLYGYKRKTTPLFDSIKDQLLVFQNVLAAAPITIPAFERMLTPANITHPDLWKKTPSIVRVAKKAGYHTYWISNHTTDAHSGIIALFAKEADEVYMTNKGKARGEGSYDESVLPYYKKALHDPYDKKLIIVHLLGSHPAYNFRYPKSYGKFTKVFDDSVATDLKKEGRATWAIVFRNLYDNSILYGDTIRYTLLKLLQESPDANRSVWIYHPDHGEDVCHHNNYSGHNAKAKEQWEIPFVVWMPKKINVDTKRDYRLDEVESTILGRLKIKTRYYHPEFDLLRVNDKER